MRLPSPQIPCFPIVPSSLGTSPALIPRRVRLLAALTHGVPTVAFLVKRSPPWLSLLVLSLLLLSLLVLLLVLPLQQARLLL